MNEKEPTLREFLNERGLYDTAFMQIPERPLFEGERYVRDALDGRIVKIGTAHELWAWVHEVFPLGFA